MIKIADEIIGRYPDFPKHMNELGKFVYYRTYSRWIPSLGRRETWKETVRRAVEYNIGLSAEHLAKIGYPISENKLHDEATLLFDNIFNLKQALSGRTFWVGSSDENSVARKYPLANFNCSFLNISKWEDFHDLLYLLMVGTGCGFKCTIDMAEKLAPIRNNVKLENIPYTPSPKEFRHDDTVFKETEDGVITLSIGDSKNGWSTALQYYFEILTQEEYEHIHTIKIFYNLIRPKGERLKTFGGTASGAEPMMEMFEKIDQVLKGELDDSLAPWEQLDNGYVKVRPIAILDIGNLIGNNVVVGKR